MRVAITGANGFIGRELIGMLLARGHQVRALVRFPEAGLAQFPIETIATGPIEGIEDWRPYLTGIDTVVHLAARAHLNDEQLYDPERIRIVNTKATLSLARSAVRRKIANFIYLSSVKVHGDQTNEHGAPFKADDPFDPRDVYARSKAEAERGLRDIFSQSKMGISILRPPLVYGAGARGNFRSLCRLVAKAPILPFAMATNRRSLIAVENLASALTCVVENPSSELRSFMISDSADFSLAQLVRLIAQGLQKNCRLAPLPVALLNHGAQLVGRGPAMRRLTQSLRVDSSPFRQTLKWQTFADSHISLKKAAIACASL